MNLGALLMSAVNLASGLIPLLGKKPTISDIIPLLLSTVIPAIDKGVAYGNLQTKEQIDQWCSVADLKTGSDAGALDLVRSMPADVEEAWLDHFVEFARVYAYNRAKLPGYYVEG